MAVPQTYAKLRTQILKLMKEGCRIVNPRRRSGGSSIEGWLRRVQAVLLILERESPSTLAKFRRLKFRRRVPDYDHENASNSAYRDNSDNLIDFNFDAIEQAVRALDIARQIVELKLPPSNETQQRRVATKRKKKKSGDSEASIERSDQPPTAAGFTTHGVKGHPYDKDRLRQARAVHNLTQRAAAEWFGVSARHYVRWEQGKTRTMHPDHHGCYEQLLSCAKQNLPLPDRCVSKMSPEVSQKPA